MGDLYYQKGIHRCAACSIEPDLVQRTRGIGYLRNLRDTTAKERTQRIYLGKSVPK